MKLLFIDTETTGVDPLKNGIIQIAGIIEINGEIKEEFNFKCSTFPQDLFTQKALEINGKTIEEIKSFEDPKIIYRKIILIFEKYIDRYNKNDKLHMVGQNPKFDYDFLSEWFKKNGNQYFYAYVQYHLIDLVVASALFNIAGLIKTPNMKLETMCKFFEIEHKAHDALEDIKVTKEIFYKFINLIKTIKMP